MPVIDFFRGKRVVDFKADQKTLNDKVIYRLRADWDNEDIMSLVNIWEAMPGLDKVTSLIIGHWFEDAPEVAAKLIELAPKMPNLTGMVWGDISYEENEMSWIENTDVAPLMMAFPGLEYFKARGGMNLDFKNLKHNTLKTLKIETGGLDKNTIKNIIESDLPELETLSIWFGSDNYGFNASAHDIKPLMIGRAYPEMKYPFPKLKNLGLANCEIADDLAEALGEGKLLLDQIQTLDMSMGTMTNRGVEALIENEWIGQLKKIDLSSNFIADSDLVDQLKSKGVKVTFGSQKDDEDEDYYYVDVAE